MPLPIPLRDSAMSRARARMSLGERICAVFAFRRGIVRRPSGRSHDLRLASRRRVLSRSGRSGLRRRCTSGRNAARCRRRSRSRSGSRRSLRWRTCRRGRNVGGEPRLHTAVFRARPRLRLGPGVTTVGALACRPGRRGARSLGARCAARRSRGVCGRRGGGLRVCLRLRCGLFLCRRLFLRGRLLVCRGLLGRRRCRSEPRLHTAMFRACTLFRLGGRERAITALRRCRRRSVCGLLRECWYGQRQQPREQYAVGRSFNHQASDAYYREVRPVSYLIGVQTAMAEPAVPFVRSPIA